MKPISVGSVCSGIEAGSVAFQGLNYKVKWLSEVADLPSRILAHKYPEIPNLGDMRLIPKLIHDLAIDQPDLICGGTPCQAFSLAGWKKGLKDDRGNLTLAFVDVINSIDNVRQKNGLPKSVVLWENVEGVLKDKSNAFGCFLASLLGLSQEIKLNRWPLAGAIHGRDRNVAWRVLDAKYFGLPHQRRRLYVIAGDNSFYPENILFDKVPASIPRYSNNVLQFEKNGHRLEVFRGYTDCLYSAYGTKWNGNAAAYNGSLFVSQNNRLRRLTPLECERLMGFPDHYTHIDKAKPTNRYQAIGNSWAVAVIQWIAKRLENEFFCKRPSSLEEAYLPARLLPATDASDKCFFYEIPTESKGSQHSFFENSRINGSVVPEKPVLGDIREILETEPDSRFFISPVGAQGILRRAQERDIKVNPRLQILLRTTALDMCPNEIEKKSRVQRRGRLSL